MATRNSKSSSCPSWLLLAIAVMALVALPSPVGAGNSKHDYKDALSKCILYFEGARSGKLPPTQRLTWRGDSGLQDGHYLGVDLSGGYYDAGDNIKFGFPLAYTMTLLAWSVIEFGNDMGEELVHAEEALRWGTDYLLKVTSQPNVIYVQVADPYADHSCWGRPEDENTPRTVYFVNTTKPGSEVAGETAAALAAASIVFRSSDSAYADRLLERSKQVFTFGNTYRGSYSESLGKAVCPFYCDFSGYQDELIWASLWINKATNGSKYHSKYVADNFRILDGRGEFGWDNKAAGISVLALDPPKKRDPSLPYDQAFNLSQIFACTAIPESATKDVTFTPGGLMYKRATSMQTPTGLSFLLLILARHLKETNQVIQCSNVQATPSRLIQVAKSQVDYILGSNPMGMAYMVGYGPKFPQKIHHRGSSLPSTKKHHKRMSCKDGRRYFYSKRSNPNLLTGAILGGPDAADHFEDNRANYGQSEPTTYTNAPMVGVFAYFAANA